jgi:guanylate kinase
MEWFMTEIPPEDRLVIISGPSGAGKSTTVRELLKCQDLPLRRSVSATTRPPRPGERDGVDYHFITHEEFQRRRAGGAFLECKEVFGQGNWYGTLREEVQRGLEQGDWVVLEIDVEGALAVLGQRPQAVTIFLHPGSMEELERRLRNRGTEGESAIQRRLEVAAAELRYRDHYRYEVINDSMEQAVEAIRRILKHCGDEADAGRIEGRVDRQ